MGFISAIGYICILICTTCAAPTAVSLANVCSLADLDRLAISGGCNFNTGTCGYQVPASLWQRHNETAGSVMFGTIPDEKSNNGLQTFALFTTSDESIPTGTSASIVTTPVTVTHTCLRFWYLMPNQNSMLEVYLRHTDGSTRTMLWQRHQVLTSQWTKVEIPLQETANFEIEFKSTKENKYAYVGLDSVTFQIEKVRTTTSEATTTTRPTTPTTTTTTTPTTTTRTTTPTTATTTPTTTPTTATTTTPTTTTTTTTAATTTTVCHCPPCPTPTPPVACTTASASGGISGQDIPRICTLSQTETTLLNTSCAFDNGLCGYQLPIYPHIWELASYRYGNGINGDHSNERRSGCCAFCCLVEDCDYRCTLASPVYGFDVLLFIGILQTVVVDTYSRGGYVVFNTDNGHVPIGARHELLSPVVNTHQETCVSFWVNMPTNDSMLFVFMEETDGQTTTRSLIWSRHNSATRGWQRVQLHILPTQPFKIVFSSVKIQRNSYLAVDDVKFNIKNVRHNTRRINGPGANANRRIGRAAGRGGCYCTCPTPAPAVLCTPPPSTPTPTTPSRLQCNIHQFAHTLTSPSCDFDSGACGWDLPMYPHLWELTRYRYGNGSLGVIDGDHSHDGDGMYIVFSTDNLHVQTGSRDEMTSPMLNTSTVICLSFWINMPTRSSLLIVQKRTKVLGDSTLAVFRGARTNGWEPVSVVVTSRYPFQIVFSSIKSGIGSYVGIDDITVTTDV